MKLKSIFKSTFSVSAIVFLRMIFSFIVIKLISNNVSLAEFSFFQLFQSILAFSVSLTIIPLQSKFSSFINSGANIDTKLIFTIIGRVGFSISILYFLGVFFFQDILFNHSIFNKLFLVISLFTITVLNVFGEFFFQFYVYHSSIKKLFIYIFIGAFIPILLILFKLISSNYLSIIGSVPLVLYTIPLAIYSILRNKNIKSINFQKNNDTEKSNFFSLMTIAIFLSLSEHLFNIVSRGSIIRNFSLKYSSEWQASLLLGNTIANMLLMFANVFIYKYLISYETLLLYKKKLFHYWGLFIPLIILFAILLYFSWELMITMFLGQKYFGALDFAFSQIIITILKSIISIIGVISIIHKFNYLLILIIFEVVLSGLFFYNSFYFITPNTTIILTKAFLLIVFLFLFIIKYKDVEKNHSKYYH
jgi:hypothetical protein